MSVEPIRLREQHDAIEPVARIVLVEDHPVVRLGLSTVLGAQSDLRILGEATDEASCLALLAEAPDLVILPLRLEGELKGVELCREIKSRAPETSVLVYTAYGKREDASSAYLSGADSFLHKGAPEARLLDTVRATLAGRKVWTLDEDEPAGLAGLERMVRSSELTGRETEVLGFMLQRFTNAEIARELFIEVATVKTHVSNILAKLGIRSRQALFAAVRELPDRAASRVRR